MAEEKILCSADDKGIVTLTINRPECHNAFDDELILSLTEILLGLRQDREVRAIVLTGAGKSFSSGADLTWMRSMAGYEEEDNFEDALRLAELLSVLDGLGKPTIARVNGAAFGGGVGLIACCDIAVAVDHARFALSEVRLGLVPAVISPYVLHAIGTRQARRFFLTGEILDAKIARDIGLVHEICAAGDLDETVDRIADSLLLGGPLAHRECKELIAMVAAADSSTRLTVMRRTAEIIAHLRISDEGQEGLSAFLEKRDPSWRR